MSERTGGEAGVPRSARELSAGLRIKTRGEFESGKVLNDFRRSCLASWFIRKSQFAQRAGRTGREGNGEREKRRWGTGRGWWGATGDSAP